MDKIDADWIKSRLKGKHGERARLAAAIGIDNDKMSKTLRGLRRVQSHEIPLILAFFNETSNEVDPQLAEVWKELEPKERVFLINAALGQIAARGSSQKQSDEDTK
jgi:hypothetical protein